MSKELSFRHKVICELPYSFIHFCIENKCLSNYINNIVTTPKGYPQLIIENHQNKILNSIKSAKQEITTNGCIAKIINGTLIWNNTKEGWDYWNRLFRKAKLKLI